MIPGVKRPCIECGMLVSQGSRCAEHEINLYGGDYPRRARAVRVSATECYWCHRPFTHDNPVQADHINAGDPTSPLVPACRKCNAGRGGRG